MDEVGLRIAGHLPKAEPRELIEALTCEQRCGRPKRSVAQEHGGDGGEVSAGGGGVDHLVFPIFIPQLGTLHRTIPFRRTPAALAGGSRDVGCGWSAACSAGREVRRPFFPKS